MLPRVSGFRASLPKRDWAIRPTEQNCQAHVLLNKSSKSCTKISVGVAAVKGNADGEIKFQTTSSRRSCTRRKTVIHTEQTCSTSGDNTVLTSKKATDQKQRRLIECTKA